MNLLSKVFYKGLQNYSEIRITKIYSKTELIYLFLEIVIMIKTHWISPYFFQ